MLLQRPTTSIRPLTTAHLAQTMSLLVLNTIELRQKLEKELAQNPALELVEENRCPRCGKLLRRAQPCPVCFNPARATPEQPLVYVSTRSEFYTPRNQGGTTSSWQEEDGDEASGDWKAAGVTLAEHVLRQIASELSVSERPIAAHFLTSLDEDGLLTITPVEVARLCRTSLSAVRRVQHLIQRADPPGIGSGTPQEAMLAQLEVLSETSSVPTGAFQAVQLGLELLSRRGYHDLAEQLGISITQAQQIVEYIKHNLTPFPARAHWGEVHQGSLGNEQTGAYYTPDVMISTLENHPESALVVEIAAPLQGVLQINPLFRQALADTSQEKNSELQTDYAQANLLIKCVQQRNHTLVRILEQIAVIQRDFILHGNEYSHPLTRAWLAHKLELHESTVSRAVADKTIQLPNRRIIPFADFFDRSLSVRTLIRQMIQTEARPLSDTKIANLLTDQGYEIARRTVAKYRNMEGLLPAHLRRQEKGAAKA